MSPGDLSTRFFFYYFEWKMNTISIKCEFQYTWGDSRWWVEAFKSKKRKHFWVACLGWEAMQQAGAGKSTKILSPTSIILLTVGSRIDDLAAVDTVTDTMACRIVKSWVFQILRTARLLLCHTIPCHGPYHILMLNVIKARRRRRIFVDGMVIYRKVHDSGRKWESLN